jgi:hypothetical protein
LEFFGIGDFLGQLLDGIYIIRENASGKLMCKAARFADMMRGHVLRLVAPPHGVIVFIQCSPVMFLAVVAN